MSVRTFKHYTIKQISTLLMAGNYVGCESLTENENINHVCSILSEMKVASSRDHYCRDHILFFRNFEKLIGQILK